MPTNKQVPLASGRGPRPHREHARGVQRRCQRRRRRRRAGGRNQHHPGRLLGPGTRLEQDDPGVHRLRRARASQVTTSYGASGDQSRGVVDGKPADIVNFSVEPDITRLVKAGKVAKDWNTDATKGIPFGSVVTLVVRKGNPKNIKDWDDLLRPGVEVITPSPLSSGSAKWNLLAPYAVKSEGGRNSQAGLDFINKLVTRARQTAARVGTRSHRRLRPGQR